LPIFSGSCATRFSVTIASTSRSRGGFRWLSCSALASTAASRGLSAQTCSSASVRFTVTRAAQCAVSPWFTPSATTANPKHHQRLGPYSADSYYHSRLLQWGGHIARMLPHLYGPTAAHASHGPGGPIAARRVPPDGPWQNLEQRPQAKGHYSKVRRSWRLARQRSRSPAVA
jgi:hypothetical protein